MKQIQKGRASSHGASRRKREIATDASSKKTEVLASHPVDRVLGKQSGPLWDEYLAIMKQISAADKQR